MARKRRIRFDDGLDVIEDIVDQDTPLDEYPAWLRKKSVGDLNWMIRDVERFWRAKAREFPVKPGPTMDPLSLAGRAREISFLLKVLRRLQRDDHDQARREASPPTMPRPVEQALVVGLRLGDLIADAQWRFNRGPATRTGLRRRKQNREAGIKSGERRGRTRDPIRDLANDIRRKHPYARRTYSTHWLAKEIGRKLHRKPDTIRKALRALHLK